MFHNVKMRVFLKEDEEILDVKKNMQELSGNDLKKEKILVEEREVLGFEDKKIKILNLTLDKKRQVKNFIDNFLKKITNKSFLLKENRLDKELKYYIRLDKKSVDDKKYMVVNHGDCYHITLSVAAYPKKEENAKQIIKEVFK